MAALCWAEGANNPRLGGRAHDGGDCGVLKVRTVNKGSLKGRSREVVEMTSRRGVDIFCLQEVRYRGVGATSMGTNEEKYKLWYSGGEGRENGVGIFIKYELAKDVIDSDAKKTGFFFKFFFFLNWPIN